MRSVRLETHILDHTQELTPSEERIAKALCQDGMELAFSSASAASNRLGVSEATLVRFARAVGYDSYQQLQHDLQEEIREHLSVSTVDRLRDSTAATSTRSDIVRASLEHDLANLETSLTNLAPEAIDRAIDILLAAHHLYVMGLRASMGTAHFAASMLRYVREDVRPLTISSDEYFEQLVTITPDDALLVFTLSRPSQRALQLATFLKEHGASVVAVCDSSLSPIGRLADVTLVVGSESVAFVQSYCAMLSVASALVAAMTAERREFTEERLTRFEEINERYGLNIRW